MKIRQGRSRNLEAWLKHENTHDAYGTNM